MKSEQVLNDRAARIYVAGHHGLVGGAIVRALRRQGYDNLLLRTSAELDLRNQLAVCRFMREKSPQFVILAAAKVGGILANDTYPADFIYDNLVIETNVIHAAYQAGVGRLLFLGSTCIYPKLADQPLKEEYLLTGPLEPTNEYYAVAKIAGIKLCEAYRKQYGVVFFSAMPTNLYGPGDNFDLKNSHVLPALIRKFHDAKTKAASHVEVWGTGTPRREFLHVDDCARACLHLMQTGNPPDLINIGTGEDVTIQALAEIVADVVGFTGELSFDRSKPDGTPRKLVDVGRLRALGWQPRITLRDGIAETYAWFLDHIDSVRGVAHTTG